MQTKYVRNWEIQRLGYCQDCCMDYHLPLGHPGTGSMLGHCRICGHVKLFMGFMCESELKVHGVPLKSLAQLVIEDLSRKAQ